MLSPALARLVVYLMAMAAISIRHASSTNMQHFTVNIYGNETHEISPTLYGLFFEEVPSQSLTVLALL